MKYALVTGGSRGIGRAICIKLAEMGYPVLINYNSNIAAAKETKRIIEENGGKAELIPFDVADGQTADNIITQWQENNPDHHIAILVNNAGIRLDNTMVFMQNEEWHKVLDTTLNGFFYLTRRVLKDMLVKRWGRVINIASLSGIKGMAGQTNYSAAKAALIGSSKALAIEVASRKVTVNVVAPGFIESDMTKDLPQDELKKLVPVGRFGKADEVADLVAFLASDKSAYITGEVISINGGLHT
ncbi:3-ketoacyl-ACP reductase [Porphyromonadaceae bacterium COT-184 OH4590]|nr:3-ketoacyl-ACP reductase [Porphyromonadaceae bacterium COT-184 OH4590]MDO4726095.1 3-oxoacyl-ACP reductase FabG [Porphyromonadaceae bacterium]